MWTVWPDGFHADYDYLTTGEMAHVRENGAVSGVGVLATYGYDDLGRRTSLTRGDGSVTSYGYDAASRLTSLADDIAGTAYDQSLGFGYNPAGQIVSNTRSNDSYAWTGHYNVNRGYTANGLNQYSLSGSVVPSYDLKGNLTSAGSTTYSYTSENKLATAGSNILAYDPLGRMHYYPQGGVTFLFDGSRIMAELDVATNTQVLRRYVFGAGSDEALVWYEGSGTTDRRFLHADERGSIVAVTNSSGTVLNVNTYDEYGIPGAANAGRFQYTGQAWLGELGMYYYKARIYSPSMGRFLQPDPIGYGDGMNAYNYVGSDPVNLGDPSGLEDEGQIVVVAKGGQCAPGQIEAGPGVCVSSAGPLTVAYRGNSYSFNVIGAPAITKGLPCTATGNRVTCTTPQPSSPPPPVHPDYCESAWHTTGQMLSDVGEDAEYAGLAAAAMGGPEFLSLSEFGGAISTVGDSISALTGDPRARLRVMFSASFGPTAGAVTPRLFPSMTTGISCLIVTRV